MDAAPGVKTALLNEFRRIKGEHAKALQARAAREVLGPSVMRVFVAHTKDDIRPLLESLALQELTSLDNERDYQKWFDAKTENIAARLKQRNHCNSRVNPGLKWGHATKILSLFVRDMVANSRFFCARESSRIERWLYAPIDSIAINRLRHLGAEPGFSRIKDIDTRIKFYRVQDALGEAARKVGVPRVWFDDNWGDRE